ncbi:hypothetical protein QMK38_08455 [Lysinibacillus fusiformis]|nr:hypothetical protein [Lysinibacillus fusiformis]
MGTFSFIVFLWQVSFGIFIITFFLGLILKKWFFMLISFITALPIAYYFIGAENYLRIVAIIVPIVLLVLTVLLFKKRKNSFEIEAGT